MQNLPCGSSFVGSLKLTYISKVNLPPNAAVTLQRRVERDRERNGIDVFLEFGVTQEQP